MSNTLTERRQRGEFNSRHHQSKQSAPTDLPYIIYDIWPSSASGVPSNFPNLSIVGPARQFDPIPPLTGKFAVQPNKSAGRLIQFIGPPMNLARAQIFVFQLTWARTT